MKTIFLTLLLLVGLVSELSAQQLPFDLPAKSGLQKIKIAKIITSKGEMVAELFPEAAPAHVANFKFLADKKFYLQKKFNIFKPGYLIQTGASDPLKPASGSGNYSLPPEFNQNKHVRGTLSMVRTPDYLDPSHQRRSHSSQFRIMLTEAPHLDQQFTVFGRIKEGMEILPLLGPEDQILDIIVYVLPG